MLGNLGSHGSSFIAWQVFINKNCRMPPMEYTNNSSDSKAYIKKMSLHIVPNINDICEFGSGVTLVHVLVCASKQKNHGVVFE